MSVTLTRRHNVDRFGYLVPTKYGNVPMVGAVATYRPGEGRFGGAVAVEEATSNLHDDPLNVERCGHSSSITMVVYMADTPFGRRKVARFDGPGMNHFISWGPPVSVNPELPVTVSLWLRPLGGELVTPRIFLGVGYHAADNSYRSIGEWVQIRKTFSPGQFTDGARVHFYKGTDGPVEVCAVQVEQKPFATSFVDGTRAAGRLSYPKSLIAGLNALTVAVWATGLPYWASGTNQYLVAAQTSGTSPYGDHFALRKPGGTNRISLWVRNDANSSVADVAYNNVWDGNWHLIVGVINKSPEPGRQPIELYVDGELVASHSNVNAVPDLSTIDETWGVQVGNWRGSLQWGGLIDELLILPYAASEEEIRTWYDADGPLPPHPAALLQWDWTPEYPAQMIRL